jgi:phospholipase C
MVNFTLCTLAVFAGLVTAIPTSHRRDYDSWKSKIKNVVVLVEENRSFDTFCGGLTYNRNTILLHLKCLAGY